jgi:hypothetical protein
MLANTRLQMTSCKAANLKPKRDIAYAVASPSRGSAILSISPLAFPLIHLSSCSSAIIPLSILKRRSKCCLRPARNACNRWISPSLPRSTNNI